MQVAKWGNSLAVRLPANIVAKLNLKPGDELNIRSTGDTTVELERKLTRQEAMARVASYARPFPPGFKFNRDELYGQDDGK